MYDLKISNLKKPNFEYIQKGIKFIKAIMNPDFYVKIPLEIIFKILHATQNNPLIKYNPSSRQENIYRLYTDKNSTDGRKIPFLKKSTIFKLIKNIGRSKSVSVYVENSDSQILHCEFDEEGFITLTAEFDNLIDVSQIDEIFRNSINPIIQEIKSVLEQSGYKLNLFNSLNDQNIEVKQMTYQTLINISKPFDIDKYKGCISSVFINETDPYKNKGKINLRFKRVSNYSKFTSQEAFILEKSEQGLRGDEIIKSLLDNFPDDLTREQAIDLVRKVANELEVERGVRKTDIKIKENPGFKTEITLDKETATLKIETENINNINYLYTLPIYLDTIVRLTQDVKSTNYPLSEINNLCTQNETEDISFDEITSTSELSAKELSTKEDEDTEFEPDETIEYTEIEKVKPKGAFSLFFDEDDSEESLVSEGGNIKGGESSSEESVTSENSTTPIVSAKIIKQKSSSDSESSVSSENSTTPIVNAKIIKQKSSSDSESSEKVELSPLNI